MQTKPTIDNFTSLQKRISDIEKRKIQASTELEMLQRQYEEKVEELKELGIEDVGDVPALLEDLREQQRQKEQEIELQLNQIEKELQ